MNERENKQHKDRINWSIHGLLALITSLLFSLTLDQDSLHSAASSIVNQSLFISLCCFILLPAAKNFSLLLANSGSSILILIVVSKMSLAAEVPALIIIRTSIVLFSLSMLLWSLTQLLEKLFPHHSELRPSIVLLAALITAAPLWMGPVVDTYQPGSTLINSVVSLSPLTHLSVAAEYDYLRAEWLYQNTSFGSLPFIYPGFAGIFTSYILCILILQTIAWRSTRRTLDLKHIDKSLPKNTKPIPMEDSTP